jgi:mRNA interferase RelE/StbE
VSYTLRFRSSAEKELLRLRNPLLARIDAALLKLTENPFAGGVKKLKNHTGYRLRVGDYRVLFEVDHRDKMIWVYAIRHRKEAYRKS